MTDFPDILNSKIIDNKWDALWTIPASFDNITNTEVIILSNPFATGSTEELQLQKMMQACTLGAEQYRVIHAGENELIPWHQLREKAKPKYIVLLGVTPGQLGISAMFHLFTPNHFDGCIWIPGLSLPELEKQPDAKRQFWQNGLKPVFVDKTVVNS